MLAKKLRNSAGCQDANVIVDDHREHARSYRMRCFPHFFQEPA